MRPRIGALGSGALLAASLCAGCATFVAYPGPPLPDAEVATITCFWRYYFVWIEECHISAVDGRRPKLSQLANLTTKLPPGRHWVEFGIERYFGGGGGKTDVCAMEHDFEAGHAYHLNAHSFEADISWMQKHGSDLYSGSIEIEETGPERGARKSYRLETTCSFGGGSLCRTTADCVQHPDIVCQLREGHPFGKCVFGP